ncbi:TIGR02270 family protein [Psychromonas sp.]|nr:TIGR02270 family protein [Psychromonas sp.]
MQELSIPNFLHKQPVYRDIYEQFCTDASFLWLLRSIVVDQPHYNLSDLAGLEQRIDAHLDGLMTNVDTGWAACKAALEFEEPGEVFTAMVIAVRSHDVNKIKHAVTVGVKSTRNMAALTSALGWLSDELSLPWIQRFLNGKDMEHKLLGISSCSIKRHDPAEMINKILSKNTCLDDIVLYSRTIRLVGELRRQDCMPALSVAKKHANPQVIFWAHWSSILLGDKSSLMSLKSFVFDTTSEFHDLAIQIVFRKLTIENARMWISQLAKDSAMNRTVIKATAVLGDPHAVNWLIEQMRDNKLAKLAGEAFVLITGSDLQVNQLTMVTPSSHPLYPNDDSDSEDVGLDEDENLPHPDINKVTALWRSIGTNFIVGQRYFMGKSISINWLQYIINNGTQRQRHSAALELALISPNGKFPNTRAKV